MEAALPRPSDTGTVQTSVMSLAGEVVATVPVASKDTGARVLQQVIAALGAAATWQHHVSRLYANDAEFHADMTAGEFGLPDTDSWSLTLVVSAEGDPDKCISIAMAQTTGWWKELLHSEVELEQLCRTSKFVLMKDPVMLELQAPVNVVGDLFGDYGTLLQLLKHGGDAGEAQYLFLGNYVDKGKYGINTLALLLAYKVKYASSFFLLRGNHECKQMTRIYGFYDECKRLYNIKLWKRFCDVFACLPVCAVINGHTFCVHGGLSPELASLSEIDSLRRPQDIPESGLLCDLLWSDPDRDITGWADNDRGAGYVFGEDIVDSFLAETGLTRVCRGHQLCEDGYQWTFEGKVLTIMTSRTSEPWGIAGAWLCLDEAMRCSIHQL